MKRLFAPVALLSLALAASGVLNFLYPYLFAAPSAREQLEGVTPAGWTYRYGLEWLQTACNSVVVLLTVWLMIRIFNFIKSANKGKLHE